MNNNSNGGDDDLLWVTDKIKEVIHWAHELAMYMGGHRQVSVVHIAASLICDRHGLFYQAIDQDAAKTIESLLFHEMMGPPPSDAQTTIRVLLGKVRAKSNRKHPIDEHLLILFVLEDSGIRFLLKRFALKVEKLKSQVMKCHKKQQKILAKNNKKVLDRFRTKNKKKKKNLLNPFFCFCS